MLKAVGRVRRAVKLVIGTPPEKRKARSDALATIATRLGFRTYGPETGWFENHEFAKIWSEFPEQIAGIHDRRFNLYNLAKALSRIPGDLAECGTYVGRSSFVMLSANADNDKHFYGFDSFEGLSAPTSDDRPLDERAKPWSAHDLAVDEARTRANLQAFEGRFTLFKGWIPDRFDEVAEKKFSFVHIDVDLHEPTLASLQFFWPRLSPGAVVVCDDYGSRRCPGARMAMDEFAAGQGLRVAELSTMQGLLFKPPSD